MTRSTNFFPSDVHSAEDLDDLLSMFDNAGIEVLDSPKVKSADGLGLEKVDEIKGTSLRMTWNSI